MTCTSIFEIRLKRRSFKPYAERETNNLLFTAKLLKQMDRPIPTDLAIALNQRGIEVTSI